MKGVFTIFLFITSIISALLRIYYLNTAKEKAFDAFEEKQYQQAINDYHYLIDSLEYNNARAKLNLSHGYYLSNDTANMINSYLAIASDSDKVVRTLTNQQIGVINTNKEDLKTALAYFKKALKADPYNDEARFNYELIKKRLENQQQKDDKKKDKKDQDKKDEQKDQEKKDDKGGDQEKKEQQEKGDKGDQKKEDQQQQDGEKKDEEGKEGEKKEQQDKKDKGDGKEDKKEGKGGEKQEGEKEKKGEQPSLTPEEQKKKEEMERQQAQMQRFENVEMSEEKAQMILNAMRQSEKQYLQQLKKQPTKSQESDKLDW